VGRFFPQSTGWIFGVGHYSGQGVVYLDKVEVRQLPGR
jgi:hypothetical protein